MHLIYIFIYFMSGTPNEIRTRVTCVKGGCPRPLDDRSITLVGPPGLEPGTKGL